MVDGGGAEISPRWLSGVLRGAGLLAGGEVSEVAATDSGAFNSRTSFLRLTYRGAAPGAPGRMVLKRSAPAAWAIEAGRAEVAFYRHVAGMADPPPGIAPCYASGIDADSGHSYLLLADLSASHRAPITREQQLAGQVATPADLRSVVDTLAAIHARWWEHPAVDGIVTGYWTRDRDRFAAYLDRRTAAWSTLRRTAELDPATVACYEHLIAALPGYWDRRLRERMSRRRQLSLVHGDTYASNFLVPREPGGTAYLLDWQSPGFDNPAGDLANLCAAFWTRAQRHTDDLERRLLRQYHQRLGAADYTLADLHEDYRRALIAWVLMPVQDAADGSPPRYWRPKMRTLLDAYRDWRCADLLG